MGKDKFACYQDGLITVVIMKKGRARAVKNRRLKSEGDCFKGPANFIDRSTVDVPMPEPDPNELICPECGHDTGEDGLGGMGFSN